MPSLSSSSFLSSVKVRICIPSKYLAMKTLQPFCSPAGRKDNAGWSLESSPAENAGCELSRFHLSMSVLVPVVSPNRRNLNFTRSFTTSALPVSCCRSGRAATPSVASRSLLAVVHMQLLGNDHGNEPSTISKKLLQKYPADRDAIVALGPTKPQYCNFSGALWTGILLKRELLDQVLLAHVIPGKEPIHIVTNMRTRKLTKPTP